MCKTRITKILIATLCVILQFFLRLNYLEMHRTYGCSANPNRARPLCDYCGRKFCQPQKLKVHIKRMHSGTCLSYTYPSTDIHVTESPSKTGYNYFKMYDINLKHSSSLFLALTIIGYLLVTFCPQMFTFILVVLCFS